MTGRTGGRGSIQEEVVTHHFKLVFLCLIGLTAGFALIGSVLSLDPGNKASATLFDLAKPSFGGLLGLVGGKSIR